MGISLVIIISFSLSKTLFALEEILGTIRKDNANRHEYLLDGDSIEGSSLVRRFVSSIVRKHQPNF